MTNKIIYGIQLQRNELTGRNQLFLNFGGNKYGYCTIKDFFENVRSWRFSVETADRTVLVPFEKYQISSRFKELDDLFIFADGVYETIGEVVFSTGTMYLLEKDEYILIKDGKIRNREIKKYKGHTIKYNLNGVYGFSIWKGKTNLEDNLWSIAECEKAIDEMLGGGK